MTAGQEYTISLGTSPSSPKENDNFTLTLTLTPGATPTPTPVPTLPEADVSAKSNANRSGSVPGKLTFTLSTPAGANVTLSYKTTGDAVAGTDYKPLAGSVTIPAGATSASVKVKPLSTADTTETLAVKVKLQAGDGYTVGSDAQAKVKIVGGE